MVTGDRIQHEQIIHSNENAPRTSNRVHRWNSNGVTLVKKLLALLFCRRCSKYSGGQVAVALAVNFEAGDLPLSNGPWFLGLAFGAIASLTPHSHLLFPPDGYAFLYSTIPSQLTTFCLTAESMESSAETRTALVRTPSPQQYFQGEEPGPSSSAAVQSSKSTRFRGNTSERPPMSGEAEPSISFSGALRRKLSAISTPGRKIADAPNVPEQIKTIIVASCKSRRGLTIDARSDNAKKG